MLNQRYVLFVININFYVPVFQLLVDSQLNCIFKRLTVSPQGIILLVKIIVTIIKKAFFHTNKCKCMSLNVG